MPPIAICIPVRDERRNMAGLIAALAGQRNAGAPVVAMVFDGCHDGSDLVAAAAAASHGVVLRAESLPRCASPDAGRARGAALALGRRIVGAQGMLLTTDADTRPASDWVARSVEVLRGADLVCGRIERQRHAADVWRVPIEAYLDRLHAVHRAIDPVAGDATPSHWQQGGASLGMTAATWDRLSDETLPATGEDRALVRAARLAGLGVRQDPAVRVRTSSRLKGRAVGGLADALRHGRAEAASGNEPMMEHPDDVIARVHRSAVARAAFPPTDVAGLAAQLGIPAAEVSAAALAATSADAFATALPPTIGKHRAVSLMQAARLLERHEHAVQDIALGSAA